MHLDVCSFVTGKPTTALGTHDPGLRSEERRMDWTLQMKGTRLQQVAIFQNISSAATQIAVLAILNRAWQAVPAFEEIEQ